MGLEFHNFFLKLLQEGGGGGVVGGGGVGRLHGMTNACRENMPATFSVWELLIQII